MDDICPRSANGVSSVTFSEIDDISEHSVDVGAIYCVEASSGFHIGPSIQTTGGDVRTMYQGDLVVGRVAMGADWLNPAAAIELQAA